MEHYKRASAEETRPTSAQGVKALPSHGAPEVAGGNGIDGAGPSVEEIDNSRRGWFAYFKTRDFYIVLILG